MNIPDYATRISGTVLCGVGIAANCLSLSYFIKNWKKGLGTRLLILLNFWDLIVVLFGFTNRILVFRQDVQGESTAGKMSFYAFALLYTIAYDCSGFSTCLISVTRTIKVCRPFYRLKGVWVLVCFSFLFMCSFSRDFTCYYPTFTNTDVSNITIILEMKRHYPLIILIGVTFCVVSVLMSTLITAYWLLKKSSIKGEISENARHATVTIIILSTVFCLLNIVYILGAVLSLRVKLGQIKDTPNLELFRNICFEAAYSLNSTLNPIIYLTRKVEMRQFLLNIWRTIRTNLLRSAASQSDQGQVHYLSNPSLPYTISRL